MGHTEKAMAPHSSTLAWKIPWTEEPGRLQSMGSLSWTRLSDFTFTFHFHALEKEMATHSSVLAWRIPGMGKPGGLPSMGSHTVRHNWSNSAAAAYFIYVYIQHFNVCQSEFIKYRDYNWILTSRFIELILCVKMRNPRADAGFPSVFVTLFLIYLQVLSQ